jgi:uncharacterized RDD family membrane protein YckC
VDSKLILERLFMIMIDHFIMCMLAMGCVWLSIVFRPGTDLVFNVSLVIAGLVYLNKDFFNAKSPAKRMFDYQVVKDDATQEKASRLQCFIRNLTVVIAPIEVVMTFISPEKRLGDYLTKTKVVKRGITWDWE